MRGASGPRRAAFENWNHIREIHLMKTTVKRWLALAGAAMAVGGGAATVPAAADDNLVNVKMLAPRNGDRVGVGGRGWFVDLEIEFAVDSVAKTGFTDFQLTGPGVHDNAAPFPGSFSPGADDRLPGLVVLLSTTGIGARSCQNIANLFNLTGVTNVAPSLELPSAVTIWDTWIIGAPNFGVNTMSTAYVAVAKDVNGDGIFNDAPAILPDADGNGLCDDKDLRAFGVTSNIRKASFFINP
jgi:hypothetical protein